MAVADLLLVIVIYFTFHYVSILIHDFGKSKRLAIAFTFHYVSILIILLQKNLCTNYPLHSIMSLF